MTKTKAKRRVRRKAASVLPPLRQRRGVDVSTSEPWADPSPSECPCCGRKVALDLIARVSQERREWEQRYWDMRLTCNRLEKQLTGREPADSIETIRETGE